MITYFMIMQKKAIALPAFFVKVKVVCNLLNIITDATNCIWLFSECQNETWGVQCENQCDCNSTNTQECNRATGCVCLYGWEGTTCSEDIDECLTPNRCSANATCLNGPGDFECQCDTGYTKVNETCIGELLCVSFSHTVNQHER